jgi:ABC-type glycerol-3-phosphate transport system substrate-binding protein
MMPRRFRRLALVVTAVAAAVALAACSGGGSPASSASGQKTVITITGPNQWNSDPKSFGAEWDAQIKRFEKAEPNIEVKTTVLPVSSFAQTLSVQLSSGTASELVFNQAPHEPYMIQPLDKYLEQPNPYVPGNKKWIDLFDPTIFGPQSGELLGTAGKYDFIPFNVFLPVVYYNEDAFKKAGVKSPPATWADLEAAAKKLKAAGYIPFGADNSDQGVGWTYGQLFEQLMHPYFDKLNKFQNNTPGTDGTAATINDRDWSYATLTKELSTTSTPETAEVLKLAKQFYTDFATPNWSGVQPTGPLSDNADFINGKAAMSWGPSFAYADVSKAKFTVGSMPFPTVTKKTTPLSSGWTARYGASVGGTSYMIPKNISGDKLKAAVKFLQFMTAPDDVKTWLGATGSFSALKDVPITDNLAAFKGSDWLKSRTMGLWYYPPKGTTFQAGYSGYLLGQTSLDDQLAKMQTYWQAAAKLSTERYKWTDDWTKAAG